MKTKLTAWQNFAIKFSGFDTYTASNCPPPVINKITGLVWVIALPCIVAIFSYGVLSFFFKPDIEVAIWAGVIASLLILILERSIMKYGRAGKFSIGFMSRAVMAVSAGWLAAEILVIGLSSGVVKQQQFDDLSIAKESIRFEYATKISELKIEIKTGQAHIDSLLQQYNLEVLGARSKDGSGKGPIASDLEKQYTAALKDFVVEQGKANATIAKLEQEREQAILDIDAVQSTDFVARLEALDKVEKQHPRINFVLWIFRLFLLAVELFPLLMKLSIGKDLQPYYDVQDKIIKAGLESFDTINKQKTIVINKVEELKFHKILYDLGQEEFKNVSNAQTALTKQQIIEAIDMAKFKDQQVQSMSGKIEPETYTDVIGDIEKIHDSHRTGSLGILDLADKIHLSNLNTASFSSSDNL